MGVKEDLTDKCINVVNLIDYHVDLLYIMSKIIQKGITNKYRKLFEERN